MRDIHLWAADAEIGETVVYYVRTPTSDGHLRGKDHHLVSSAWNAHKAGLVFLAQRRVRSGPRRGALEYQATRISTPTAATLRLLSEAYQPSLSYRRA